MQPTTLRRTTDEQRQASSGAWAAFREHWPEYLSEAGCLALFMLSACSFGVLLEHPGSPVRNAIENHTVRRGIMGIAMGSTAIAIISSKWGKRSGAHLNPAVTLSFLSLGKVRGWDAFFYIAMQFAGGVAGVALAEFLLGPPLSHSSVNYVTTHPGVPGPTAAFLAEALISLILMSVVLQASNRKRFAAWTPFLAGILVAIFITIESPVSGMSMNPARTFGSAVPAAELQFLWLYFTAPPLGMLLAAQIYRMMWGTQRVYCAKLHHHNSERCIFRCNYQQLLRDSD